MDAPRVRVAATHEERAAEFRALLGSVLDDAYRRAAVVLANRFEAEDAVHDAAERAWRSWSSLRDRGSFEAWFARILLNVCRDRLRARRRVALVEVTRELPDREDEGAGAFIGSIDQRARVLDALSDLSPDERIAIVLRYEADLTVLQIARLTGAREGTIKARIHHALRRLRARLAEEES
jgi:RNA polymerase sigma-70 factor (ECF subfamily)